MVILVAVLAWAGYVLVKLIGPMMAPARAPRERVNVRPIALWGLVVLVLLLFDQYLLGRFRLMR